MTAGIKLDFIFVEGESYYQLFQHMLVHYTVLPSFGVNLVIYLDFFLKMFKHFLIFISIKKSLQA